MFHASLNTWDETVEICGMNCFEIYLDYLFKFVHLLTRAERRESAWEDLSGSLHSSHSYERLYCGNTTN